MLTLFLFYILDMLVSQNLCKTDNVVIFYASCSNYLSCPLHIYIYSFRDKNFLNFMLLYHYFSNANCETEFKTIRNVQNILQKATISTSMAPYFGKGYMAVPSGSVVHVI